MATMILLPDDTTAISSGWSLNAAAGTADQVLSSDDGNTSYMACNTSGEFMRLAFADPDDVTSAIEFSIAIMTIIIINTIAPL